MKRRKFFGLFGGLVGGTAAAAVLPRVDLVESLDLPVAKPAVVPQALVLPSRDECWFSSYAVATAVSQVSTTYGGEYDRVHNIVQCSFCGRRGFADYANCAGCGAPR